MVLSLTRPNFRLLFLIALAAALVVSSLVVRIVHAETLSSDLAIQLVSAPKHVKACQVFDVTFEITNLGPDAASSLFVFTSIPDALGTLDIQGVPDTLAAGETATVTATFKVVAFTPGETREAWVGAGVSSDTSTDPNWENNRAEQSLRLIGKPQPVCS